MTLKNRYLLTAAAAAALIASATSARASVIAFQGYEGTTADTWTDTLGGVYGSISNSDPSTDTPPASRVRTGSYSYQQNSQINSTPENVGTQTFATITVSGYTSVQVTINVAAVSTTTGNGEDAGDYVAVFSGLNGAAINDSSLSGADVEVTGNGNAHWSFNNNTSGTAGTGVAEVTAGNASDPIYKPSGNGARTTDGYSTIELDLPAGTNTFTMEIDAATNSTGEVWAIDDVSVTGTPVPEPVSAGAIVLAMAGGLLVRRRPRYEF